MHRLPLLLSLSAATLVVSACTTEGLGLASMGGGFGAPPPALPSPGLDPDDDGGDGTTDGDSSDDSGSDDGFDPADADGDGVPDSDPFDAPLSAEEEACGIVGALQCGHTVTLDTTTDGVSNITSWGPVVGNWSGPEVGFRFAPTDSGEVTFKFVDAVPTELDQDILLVARDHGACDPFDTTGVAFNSNTFEVEAGQVYSVFVDGYDGDAGAFTLQVECELGTTTDAPDDGTGEPTPDGYIAVNSLPFSDDNNNGTGQDLWDSYGCAAQNESGSEVVYQVAVPEAGFLSAGITDASADVDVHILSTADAAACVDRGDHNAGADVTPGTYYVVVDGYNGAQGDYTVQIGLYVPSAGACATESYVVDRPGSSDVTLPATGNIVKEAHLVTTADPMGAAGTWPNSLTDRVDVHHAVSQDTSGFVMARQEPWAPCCEPSNEFGQGAVGGAIPADAEAWYLNMRWVSPYPHQGRFLVEANGKAVVVQGGFETGPGNLSNLGGVPEEVHFYLGTGHLSQMTISKLTNNALPLGPRTCN